MKLPDPLPFRKLSHLLGTVKSAALLCCAVLSAALAAQAQDGTLDISFDPGVGPRGGYDYVQSIALQQDGKVLIAGDFETVDGVKRLGIARLNADGSLDASFVPVTGINGSSYGRKVAVQLDGKILYHNIGYYRYDFHELLLRFNPDGSRDPNFSYRGDIHFNIYSLTILPDSKLLILGTPSSDIGGYAIIQRLNSDGSIDNTFNSSNCQGGFTDAVVQPDGKIIVSGSFSSINGAALRNFARLNADGTLDPTFLTQFVSGDYPALKLLLQPDGKVLAGGATRTVGGSQHYSICRLNTDGSFDNSYALDAPSGFGFCIDLALQADGKIIAQFTQDVIRLNPDGTLDTSFNVATTTDSSGAGFRSLFLGPDGKVLTCGDYATLNGVTRQHIARLNNTLPASASLPQITSPASATGAANAAFNYQIIATASPLSYSVAHLPVGLTIDAATGILSGTPATPGTFNLIVAATNLTGTGTARLTLTFAPAAVAVPVITSPTGALGQYNTAFEYQITATNAPATYSASGLPAGLIVNSQTGLISGTPTVVGTFSVTLGATNAGGTGSANLILRVTLEPPPAPVVTSAATATGQTGRAFSYQITATNFPTAYTAYGLPDGLSVDASTGLISGMPTRLGSFQVSLYATNAGGSGYATLNLTIAQAPIIPVITSVATASGRLGQAFAYQITADNAPTSFNAAGLPAGLSVNLTDGLISGTSTAAGTFNVSLSAINAAGTGTASLALTITSDPAVAAPTITSGGATTVKAGQAFSYQITASNNPTSYTASGLPEGLGLNGASGLISGTPVVPGSYAVSLSATNGGGTGAATLTLTVTSDPTTPAPVITNASSASGQAGKSFTFQITGTNGPTSYAVSNLPVGLSVNSTSGTISGTPLVAGTLTIVVSASNAGGTGKANLTLKIAPSSSVAAPVITSATGQAAQVGKSFAYQIAASNSPIRYAATGLPPGLEVSDVTGRIFGTPTKTGAFTITLSATNAGGTGTGKLTLTVTTTPPVEEVPTVSFVVPGANGGKSTQIVEGGAPLKLKVVRTGTDLSQPLTVAYKPKGGNVPGVDYKVLSGTVTIPAGATGAKIKLRAFDDSLADGNKTLKIKLIPPADGSYSLGVPAQAKIRIIDLQSIE